MHPLGFRCTVPSQNPETISKVVGIHSPTRLSIWLCVIALPLLLQTIVFYHSLNYGILRGLLARDDAYAILQIMERISYLLSGDIIAVNLRRMVHLWFHSPLTNLKISGSLLLSGGNVLAPYAINFWALSLALYLTLTKSQLVSTPKIILVTLTLALQPLTFGSLIFLKSDFSGGVFLAAGIFLMYRATICEDFKMKLYASTLLSLAVIAKMTAFYSPVLAIGILIIFEIYQRLRDWEKSGSSSFSLHFSSSSLRAFWICVAIVLFPYLFFFSFTPKHYISYISAALGDVWADGLSIADRALYYSPYSADGSAIWGKLHIALCLFVLSALACAVVRRSWSGALLVVMLCGAIAVYFLPLIVARSSNIEFAGPALGVVLGTTLVSAFVAVALTNRLALYATLTATLVLICLTRAPLDFDPPTYGGAAPVHRFTRSEIALLSESYDQIASRIALETKRAEPSIAFFFHHTAAVPPNLSIKYFHQTSRFLLLLDVWDLSNEAAVRAALAGAEFFLAVSPLDRSQTAAVPGMNSAFAISADPDRANVCLSQKPYLSRIDGYAIPGGTIHLYKKAKEVTLGSTESGLICAADASRGGN